MIARFAPISSAATKHAATLNTRAHAPPDLLVTLLPPARARPRKADSETQPALLSGPSPKRECTDATPRGATAAGVFFVAIVTRLGSYRRTRPIALQRSRGWRSAHLCPRSSGVVPSGGTPHGTRVRQTRTSRPAMAAKYTVPTPVCGCRLPGAQAQRQATVWSSTCHRNSTSGEASPHPVQLMRHRWPMRAISSGLLAGRQPLGLDPRLGDVGQLGEFELEVLRRVARSGSRASSARIDSAAAADVADHDART